MSSLLFSCKWHLKQFSILTRHFFKRLFQNDYVAFEEEMKLKTIALLIIAASFLGYIAHRILFWYWLVKDINMSWVEKCYFISLFMAIIGFISLLQWENLFPDTRDYANLIGLPINTRIILAAKFASLFLYIGIFALGTNLISALVFWWYLPKWISSSVIFGAKFVAAHLISGIFAAYSTFFILFLIIGILKSIFGLRFFKKITVYLKSLFLTISVILIFQIITQSSMGTFHYDLPYAVRSQYHLSEYLFPPMWFSGLYEYLIGNNNPYFEAMAVIAVLVLAGSFLSCVLALGLNFRLHILKAGESGSQKTASKKIRHRFADSFNKVFLKHPIQRVVFNFFRQTLKNSNLHKNRLAAFSSISIGIVIVLLVNQSASLSPGLQNNRILLMIPLIISSFLLIGIRAVIKIPTSLDANWVFKLTEIKSRQHYLLGFRKGVFFLLLVPLYVVLLIYYSLNWGILTSFYHCFFGLVISAFLMELLFLRYRKIPFTCSYLPGQDKIHFTWIVYAAGFLLFLNQMERIEARLLAMPSSFLLFYGLLLLLYLGLRVYAKRKIYQHIQIIYEEEPLQVVQSFGFGK